MKDKGHEGKRPIQVESCSVQPRQKHVQNRYCMAVAYMTRDHTQRTNAPEFRSHNNRFFFFLGVAGGGG